MVITILNFLIENEEKACRSMVLQQSIPIIVFLIRVRRTDKKLAVICKLCFHSTIANTAKLTDSNLIIT